MQAVVFGYKCQECGRGTVVERVFPEYSTKIRGYPFVVKNARVGVCDRCSAEHFSAKETERWERLFEAEHAKLYLDSEDVQGLRKALGLSMEQFAFLIGCTRQSLYNWERPNRSRPQSRMADLLMKLARVSHEKGEIDVLQFLVQDAGRLGIHIDLSRGDDPPYWKPILLSAKKVPRTLANIEHPQLAELAADTGGEGQSVVLSSQDGETVGRLSYDFQTASLVLDFTGSLTLGNFDVEIRFRDGQVEESAAVQVEGQRATLLAQTRHNEDDVIEVVLHPCIQDTEKPK